MTNDDGRKSDYQPRRFALKFDPPTIVLEYSSRGKLYHHKIAVRNVGESDADPEAIATGLLRKHRKYLAPTDVSMTQVADLVSRLICEHARRSEQRLQPGGGGGGGGSCAGAAAAAAAADEGSPQEPNQRQLPLMGDLNKVSEFALEKAKANMTVGFEKNVVRPGDAEYEYDRRVDFGDPDEDCGWDSDESADDGL